MSTRSHSADAKCSQNHSIYAQSCAVHRSLTYGLLSPTPRTRCWDAPAARPLARCDPRGGRPRSPLAVARRPTAHHHPPLPRASHALRAGAPGHRHRERLAGRLRPRRRGRALRWCRGRPCGAVAVASRLDPLVVRTRDDHARRGRRRQTGGCRRHHRGQSLPRGHLPALRGARWWRVRVAAAVSRRGAAVGLAAPAAHRLEPVETRA